MALERINMDKKIVYKSKEDKIMLDSAKKH
jgi:hypothetical protein